MSYELLEIGDRAWRIATRLGDRNLFQYLLADDDGRSLLIDTGTADSPRDAILPALHDLRLSSEDVALVVVTHPDVDHQGGLAVLRDALPGALTACGFADLGLVGAPERLIADRYAAYEHAHGLGYGEAEKSWMRSLYGAPVWIDRPLAGGERLVLGRHELSFLHAPGHSHGHLIVHERASGMLFTSDAVHGRWIPAIDGSAALPPTYEEVDPYLATIDLVESLQPTALHSGHWRQRAAGEVGAWLQESREFVARLDAELRVRLDTAATLRELCDHVDRQLGPFPSGSTALMFAVHGHLRRMVRNGVAQVTDVLATPPRFRSIAAK